MTIMSSLDTQAIASIHSLQRQAASLLLYQSVLSGEVGFTFLDLLQTLRRRDPDGLSYLQAYGRWFQALAAKHQSWQDYLITQILRDENPFTQQIQHAQLEHLPPALVAAAQQDLQALQSLYECSGTELSYWVQEASGLPLAPVAWYQEQDQTSPVSEAETKAIASVAHLENWAEALEDLAAYYRQWGTGILTEYRALRWQSGHLHSPHQGRGEFVGIAHPDPVELTELFGYESQQGILLKNTEFLLAGYPALHVLLYGSRGSGKSSLVKGLLNRYRDRNLRLIEVAKSNLQDLPEIVEKLRSSPQKFIIFVDDLSFEEDDDAFKALKVVLEGSITARPQNVVVYATSNRRHLIREFFGDRPRPSENEEIHVWDTVQEKLSFSDRFGLTLTFEPAEQNTYLTIVRNLAAQAGITLSQEDIEARALQWATRHNGRSGRTARQFIDFLQAELAIAKQ
jgi:uncharacterized protein